MVLPDEELVNGCLSEIFEDIFGKEFVTPEKKIIKKGKRRKFDILIEYKGIDYVLEASYDKNDAIKDAKKRIEEGLIDTIAIAIHYTPENFENSENLSEIKEILLNEPLRIRVFAKGADISKNLLKKKYEIDNVTDDWMNININEFIELFSLIEGYTITEDEFSNLIDKINDSVNYFVSDALEKLDKNPKLRKLTYSNLYKTLFTSSGKNSRILVPNVPKDVLLAQSHISLLMASILYESIAPIEGLNSLQFYLNKHSNNPLSSLQEAFNEILKINYEPAFDIAVGILIILYNIQNINSILNNIKEIFQLSSDIVGNKVFLRQDFIGHVYHKVTGDIAMRKGYATYYTKSPIAYFLAYLAIQTPNKQWKINWSDFTKLVGFKINDFACGSGTLVSAAYEAISSKYRKTCFLKGIDINIPKFHSLMLEKTIWGFDALEYAVQTASIILSLREPGIKLKNMNTYHIPIDETGSLGSLNYWWANMQLISIERRSISKKTSAEVKIPFFNFIIMNPPFSRTTAPGKIDTRPRIFDFAINERIFENLMNKYKEIINNIVNPFIPRKSSLNKDIAEYVGKGKTLSKSAINPLNAGASFPFIFLADKYLRKGGKMALVLPKTVIESAAYFLLRYLLISKYNIEYIVVSTEPNNPNFSYSTNFSEILIIARKLFENEEPNNEDTKIINLKSQPKNPLEGVRLAKEIINKFSKDSERKIISILPSEAEIFSVKQKILKDFMWNFSILIDNPPNITKLITNLLDGNIFDFQIPIFKINELPKNNPFEIIINNPREYRGGNLTEKFDFTSTGQYKILRKTGKKVIISLFLSSEKKEAIRPKNEEGRKSYREKGSRILIPESIRFNTTPLLATWSQEKIISTVAYMIKVKCDQEEKSIQIEKCLSVWFNSSFIICFLKAIFSTLASKYGHIRGWHIQIIPILDFEVSNLLNNFVSIFDKYKDNIWESLPIQYEKVLNGIDMKRLDFDLDIIEAIATSYNIDLKREKYKEIFIDIYRELLEII
ncbi:MAG: hypothetical protein ACTSVV_13635 [Promethearchaeota archaeon]